MHCLVCAACYPIHAVHCATYVTQTIYMYYVRVKGYIYIYTCLMFLTYVSLHTCIQLKPHGLTLDFQIILQIFLGLLLFMVTCSISVFLNMVLVIVAAKLYT